MVRFVVPEGGDVLIRISHRGKASGGGVQVDVAPAAAGGVEQSLLLLMRWTV